MISWALAYAVVKTDSSEYLPLIFFTGIFDLVIFLIIVGIV